MTNVQRPVTRPAINLRVVVLLLILFAMIAAAVVVTDSISPRDRQPTPELKQNQSVRSAK
jgi:hypothetical protein